MPACICACFLRMYLRECTQFLCILEKVYTVHHIILVHVVEGCSIYHHCKREL